MPNAVLRIRGKVFTDIEIGILRSLIETNPTKGRIELSRIVCQHFSWRQPNGQLQDVGCRALLLKLERRGIICLPPRKQPGGNTGKQNNPPVLELALEELPVTGRLGEFAVCQLIPITQQKDSNHWNALIHRYHYLGYRPMVGRSLKYWIKLGSQDVGVIGWGSPSWKLASRDEFIGWDIPARERNLQGIANNTRFLIFPWVHVKYLASHVLSLCARQVPTDWKARYGVELFLFETFVDATKYRGTCYKAANWVRVGQSKGASKSGDSYHYHGQKKDVYVYPLRKDFRECLCR
jgi:hypothetical protein